MKTLLLLTVLALTSCTNVTVENAEIGEAHFNNAHWKSQAGVHGNADIEATTSPTTDASLTGL